MIQIKQRTPKRFRIYWLVSSWVCEDNFNEADLGLIVGVGKTPEAAHSDCMKELEMATSDIHK